MWRLVVKAAFSAISLFSCSNGRFMQLARTGDNGGLDGPVAGVHASEALEELDVGALLDASDNDLSGILIEF